MTDQRIAGLESLLAEAGIGTWTWDPSSNIVVWDSVSEAIYGLEQGTFPGTMDAFMSYVHPDDRDDVSDLIGKVATRGGLYSIQHRIVWDDGTVRWIEGQGRIESTADGTPVRGYGIVYDITDRATFERERDESRRREAAAVEESIASRSALDFLIEAGDALSGSLNTQRVLEKLTDLFVTHMADFCIVDLRLEEPVGWITTGVRTVGGRKYERVTASPATMTRAVRRMMAVETGGQRDWQADELIALDGNLPEIALAGHEIVARPLISRGAAVGSLVVGRRGQWTVESAALVEALARRAAVALDQAELYRDRSTVAEVFQRSMNPGELPPIPDVELGILYRPAAELVRLGGDLYDVFKVGDSWTLVVGDVCGKGVVAAGHAGMARSSMRAAAQASRDPAEALAVLNKTLLQEESKPLLTAVVATMAAADDLGRRTVTVAAGGHPAPIVVRRDGSTETIEASGTMLGFTETPDFTVSQTSLEPGDTLAMFTDGVLESRRGDEFFGIERLHRALQEVGSAPAQSIAEAVGARLDTWTAEPMTDDIVLLLAKINE